VSANAQHSAAAVELDKQRRINDQMNAVKREQVDLQKKIADINYRIDAIQKLRASQQGPSGVLAEIKSRFDAVPGLYLKSVEQKEAEVTIKGESPNEASVTRFGQSLEFSSGLFTNLNIETQREVSDAVRSASTASAPTAPAQSNSVVALPEVVSFTIKCNYGRAAQPQANGQTPAPNQGNNVAAKH
jgi:Tfp pilus assembly protein PilN